MNRCFSRWSVSLLLTMLPAAAAAATRNVVLFVTDDQGQDAGCYGNKVIRTPISKQRNKHIQRMLVEAARLAPRFSAGLAELYERERLRGNANRATLAVARKMVAHMLAVERRKTDFIAAERFKPTAAA